MRTVAADDDDDIDVDVVGDEANERPTVDLKPTVRFTLLPGDSYRTSSKIYVP